MNPFVAAVIVIIGLASLTFSVVVGVDEVRCYRRGEMLSAAFGAGLMFAGLAVAASCFASLWAFL